MHYYTTDMDVSSMYPSSFVSSSAVVMPQLIRTKEYSLKYIPYNSDLLLIHLKDIMEDDIIIHPPYFYQLERIFSKEEILIIKQKLIEIV